MISKGVKGLVEAYKSGLPTRWKAYLYWGGGDVKKCKGDIGSGFGHSLGQCLHKAWVNGLMDGSAALEKRILFYNLTGKMAGK
jgi:hypothetical protein